MLTCLSAASARSCAALIGSFLVVSIVAPAQAYTCGFWPFEHAFESSKYCVQCQGVDFKLVEICPGGDAGKIALQQGNPGCNVDFASPRACGHTSQFSARLPPADRVKCAS
jgi:hypothetical protein